MGQENGLEGLDKELYSGRLLTRIGRGLRRSAVSATLLAGMLSGTPAIGDRTVKNSYEHHVTLRNSNRTYNFPVTLSVTGPETAEPGKAVKYVIELHSPNSYFSYNAVIVGVEMDSGHVLDGRTEVYLKRGGWIRQDAMTHEEYRNRWGSLGEAFDMLRIAFGGDASGDVTSSIADFRLGLISKSIEEVKSNVPYWTESGEYDVGSDIVTSSGRYGSNYGHIKFEIPVVINNSTEIKFITVSNIYAPSDPIVLGADFYVDVEIPEAGYAKPVAAATRNAEGCWGFMEKAPGDATDIVTNSRFFKKSDLNGDGIEECMSGWEGNYTRNGMHYYDGPSIKIYKKSDTDETAVLIGILSGSNVIVLDSKNNEYLDICAAGSFGDGNVHGPYYQCHSFNWSRQRYEKNPGLTRERLEGMLAKAR